MSVKRILSLGQCGADHGAIEGLIRRHFDAEVIPVDTFDEATDRLRQGGIALVLVNRVLNYGGDPGVDFIAALKKDAALSQVPVMLVSNHEDAQQEAVALGALPGFGKSALGSTTTLNRLRQALGTD